MIVKRSNSDPHAALRAEFAAYRVETDAKIAALMALIAELQRRNANPVIENDDVENKPRSWPPGNWVTVKIAVAESGYSPSGIRSMVDREIVGEERRGGKVYVNLDQVGKKQRGGKKCEKV
jgi:hypothetical protein